MAHYRSTSGKTLSGFSGGAAAPSDAHLGQFWFNSATGVTYQYTTDGASFFWLDISSGGIGTSLNLSVDYVGDTDPHKETNGASLAVGKIYYNRETNRYFECTTATTNNNVWRGRYIGFGGIESNHTSGTTHYRCHKFLDSGRFELDGTKTCEILLVGGGGGGGVHSGGGGGAGGLLYYGAETPKTPNGAAVVKAAGSYDIVIGVGGTGLPDGQSHGSPYGTGGGSDGTATTAFGFTAAGGGGGASGGNGTAGRPGGSGGGGGRATAGGTGPSGQGNSGGHWGQSGSAYPGGGGGGAGAVGTGGSSTAGGVGGVGLAYTISGASVYYAGGGGGNLQDASYADASGVGGNGGGGDGGNSTQKEATNGHPNTGGGGGGAMHNSTVGGATGGTGIVIIRYALN